MSSVFEGSSTPKTSLEDYSKTEIVSLERVTLQYDEGPCVFQNVSYNIFAGNFYFLTGNSGAGKTSFLKLLYRALKPTYGRIKIFGYDLNSLELADLPLFRQHIGLIFQDCRLIESLTILENVALSIHINGCRFRKSCNYAKELLEWVGLHDKLDAFPEVLSDGQRQRVAIARAIVKRPALLLADEPTGNLDDQNALRLMALFEELHRMGTTIIFATHNNTLIKNYQHPKLLLKNGSLYVSRPSEKETDPPKP